MKASLRSLICLFSACASGGVLSARAESVATELPSTVATPAEKPQERPSLHDLKNLRDPFKRPQFEGPSGDEEKLKSELERVPITELFMVGVLTGPNKTRALVRGPSGSVFPVSDGTRVGTQNGYVRKVLPDRIIVNEIVQDIVGDREVITTELKLNPKGVIKGLSSVKPPAKVASTGSVATAASSESSGESSQNNKDASPAQGAAPQTAPTQSAPAQSAAPQTAPTQSAGGAPKSNFTLPVPPPVAPPKTGMGSIQPTSPGFQK